MRQRRRYGIRYGIFQGRLAMGLLATLMLWALAGCGGTSATSSSTTSTSAAKGTVSVAYAGSLVNLMEHQIGPAFSKATGYGYQGKGAGSTALANQIKSKLIAPDVFVSVSAGADKSLMGAANGNLVTWYAPFAATSMVIGYSPKSRFAAQFQAAATGNTPWYSVLEQPGIRIGRTDPKLDPKGVNTLLLMQLAERYYSQPGLSQKILGSPENPAQIFPEEDLVARLSGGQLDAGFFYLNEVKAARLPYITLPAQINLGDPTQADYYAQASYTSSDGKIVKGAPVEYTVTILANARNQAGAVAFVKYLLQGGGAQTLQAAGITPIPPTTKGDAQSVPSGLSNVIQG